jgi:ATP-dependent helicase HrpB
MVVAAGAERAAALAADIAVVLTERGLGGTEVDLRHRLDAFRRDRSRRAEEARRMAMRWADIALSPPGRGPPSEARARDEDIHSNIALSPRPCPHRGEGEGSIGALLALAYPERIAKARGDSGTFLLANGRGASLDPASPLAREPFLAVAELAGSAAQSRILLAAPIALDEIEARFAARIEAREEMMFDAASAAVRARRIRRFGAIVLAEQPLRLAPGERVARVLAEGIARLSLTRLPWTKGLEQWRDRVMFLRRSEGDEWPDLADATLAASIGEWLAPALAGKTALAELCADEFAQALSALLPWTLRRRLDAEAPTHFAAPSGSKVPIDYAAEEGPKLRIRVQELFGLDRHPTIAGGRVPLAIELLSPAHRPVQVTRDLPGFWRGSYRAVKAEMKGRYPKHPWPDDPLAAPATRRAKPRGR